MTQHFLRTLLDEASRPFHSGGRFAYHYARGKLSSDSIFREILRRGLFRPKAAISTSVAARAACSPGCSPPASSTKPATGRRTGRLRPSRCTCAASN